MTSKPTFGAGDVSTTIEEIRKERKNRPEIGAIWENKTKNDSTYMNIKFKMPKSELQKLIENSNIDENGNVVVGFVAFPNRKQEGNSRRPAYRIFKELNSKDLK